MLREHTTCDVTQRKCSTVERSLIYRSAGNAGLGIETLSNRLPRDKRSFGASLPDLSLDGRTSHEGNDFSMLVD